MRITLAVPNPNVCLGWKKHYVRGKVYDLPEDEALKLLAQVDTLGRKIFRLATEPSPEEVDAKKARANAMLEKLLSMDHGQMSAFERAMAAATEDKATEAAAPEAPPGPEPEPEPEAEEKPKPKPRKRKPKTLAEAK
jgi:outer membrane biosynthesis protein TonB